MRVKICAGVIAAIVGVAAFAAIAGAQSLGDLAKKEEARRKEVKQPAKVYTNKDLGGAAEATPPTPPAGESGESAKPQAAADTTKEAPKAAAEADKDKNAPQKDQAYWSGRKKELQTKLDRDQTFADALQSRINGLTTDFAARDDPAQRSRIERDRQKSIAELARLKQDILNDK